MFSEPLLIEYFNRIGFHLKRSAYVFLWISHCQNMHTYTICLRNLHGYTEVFVSGNKDGIGYGTVLSEFNQVRDDQRIDALLFAYIVHGAQAQFDPGKMGYRRLLQSRAWPKQRIIPIHTQQSSCRGHRGAVSKGLTAGPLRKCLNKALGRNQGGVARVVTVLWRVYAPAAKK